MRRVRTPIFAQMERAECGAACLGSVLAYHGSWLSLDALRLLCGVSRDGSRAGSIVRAARSLGMRADGLAVDAAGTRALAVPFIAFWDQAHFVVVEGVGRRVAINDPASGRRRIAWGEYARRFSGVALDLAPGPAFRRQGSRPGLGGMLLRRLSGQLPAIVFLLLASLLLALPGLVAPGYRKLFTDQVLLRGYADWLAPLLFAMALTAVLQIALAALQLRHLLRLEVWLSVAGAAGLLRRLLRLPLAFHAQRGPSELAVRATQPEALAQLLAANLGPALLALPPMLLFAAMMLLLDGPTGAFCLAVAAVELVALAATASLLGERQQAVQLVQTRLNAVGAGGLRMAEDLKATGSESLLFTRIAGLKAQQESLNAAYQRLRALLLAAPVVVQGIGQAGLLGLGGWRVMSGHLTEGALLAMQGLLLGLLAPAAQLVGMGQQIQTARGHLAQIDDAMAKPVAAEFAQAPPPRAARVALGIAGRVGLEGVSFGYAPLEPPLLRDISLVVQPGEWLAIAGASGSGKSTLARLIAGLELPRDGVLTLDGRAYADLPAPALRRAIAMVEQSTVLFDGTLREAVTLWDTTLADATVTAAVATAELADLVAVRQGGYEARLGEDGGNLSGGQRALLDLSRAIAQGPAVLVLDEATAALDAPTEQRVIDNLRRLGCTVILVAHRASTLAQADAVVVLEDGRIVERGPPDVLADAGGAYARLLGRA